MLPNLLVIGAMKCATSSICSYLENHPDVFFLRRSEPDFFSKDQNWEKGVGDYEQLFDGAERFIAVGEGSNSYSNVAVYPETPARIRSIIPNVKLVYSVRHPIERIVSAWAQIRVQSPDLISHDLNKAVRSDPELTVYPSYYWKQVDSYLQHFPREQLWLGFLEDLKRDPSAFFTALCTFASINPLQRQNDPVRKNPTAGRPMLGANYTRLRRAPGAGLLRALLPSSVKNAAKKMMAAPSPSPAELLARLDLPDRLHADLRDDARRFLEFAGRAPDYWEF